MSEMAQMRDTQQAHTKILMLLQTQAEQTTKGIELPRVYRRVKLSEDEPYGREEDIAIFA